MALVTFHPACHSEIFSPSRPSELVHVFDAPLRSQAVDALGKRSFGVAAFTGLIQGLRSTETYSFSLLPRARSARFPGQLPLSFSPLSTLSAPAFPNEVFPSAGAREAGVRGATAWRRLRMLRPGEVCDPRFAELRCAEFSRSVAKNSGGAWAAKVGGRRGRGGCELPTKRSALRLALCIPRAAPASLGTASKCFGRLWRDALVFDTTRRETVAKN
ncbi:hypothetical protein HPB48_007946 [Haemaphysalis longicornis]|uniref:Uncharacterized protein n=1 Tax=Haemaphysalis longicornis TaxID=44386 RepID=A0A9J6FL60_HAELO|nr:hypothetical protein HPB48_007946 [Haemaphysalis longicornis]